MPGSRGVECARREVVLRNDPGERFFKWPKRKRPRRLSRDRARAEEKLGGESHPGSYRVEVRAKVRVAEARKYKKPRPRFVCGQGAGRRRCRRRRKSTTTFRR